MKPRTCVITLSALVGPMASDVARDEPACGTWVRFGHPHPESESTYVNEGPVIAAQDDDPDEPPASEITPHEPSEEPPADE